MAKDDDIIKGLDEEEDLLDFDFEKELMLDEEEGETQEGETEHDEEIIDLVDVVEKGSVPKGHSGEEVEGLDEFFMDEEEAEVEEHAQEEVKEEDQQEDVIPDFSQDGRREGDEETVIMEKRDETVAGEPETFVDFETGAADEDMEFVEEPFAGQETEELKDEFLEKLIEQEDEIEEQPVEEDTSEEQPSEQIVPEAFEEKPVEAAVPLISEEKIEALLTKVVSEVLEKVAREVIPDVAEKIIKEEIEALKKSIIPEG